eukprot:1184833-Prorocentrum_minimum.AAC.1
MAHARWAMLQATGSFKVAHGDTPRHLWGVECTLAVLAQEDPDTPRRARTPWRCAAWRARGTQAVSVLR